MAIFLYKRKETSPRLTLLPITTKPSHKERRLLFMVGVARAIFQHLRQRGVEKQWGGMCDETAIMVRREQVRGNFPGIFKYLESPVYFLALILGLSATILF
jgi:hypothetical protein